MTQIHSLKLQENNQNNTSSNIHQPLFQLKAYSQEKRLITWQLALDEKLHHSQENSFLWIADATIHEKSIPENLNLSNVEDCYTAINSCINNLKNNAEPQFLLIGLPQKMMISLQIPLLKKLATLGIIADIIETGAACRMIKILQEEQRPFFAVLIP